MSGLRMNAEKNKAIWIGLLSYSTTRLCHKFRFDWTEGPLEILGVTYLTEIYNIWDLNYNGIIKKVEVLANNGQKEN